MYYERLIVMIEHVHLDGQIYPVYDEYSGTTYTVRDSKDGIDIMDAQSELSPCGSM